MQLRHIYFFCFNGGILVCVEVFGLAVVDMSAAQKREYKYSLTLSRLMSYIYIYGAPILDVSRSHTTTQHSR